MAELFSQEHFSLKNLKQVSKAYNRIFFDFQHYVNLNILDSIYLRHNNTIVCEMDVHVGMRSKPIQTKTFLT